MCLDPPAMGEKRVPLAAPPDPNPGRKPKPLREQCHPYRRSQLRAVSCYLSSGILHTFFSGVDVCEFGAD